MTVAMALLSVVGATGLHAQGPYRAAPDERKTVSWLDFPFYEPRPSPYVAPVIHPATHLAVPTYVNPNGTFAYPYAMNPGYVYQAPQSSTPVGMFSPSGILQGNQFANDGGASFGYIPVVKTTEPPPEESNTLLVEDADDVAEVLEEERDEFCIRVSPFTYTSGCGLVVGAGVGFLEPNFDNNVAFTLQDQRGFPNFVDTNRDFNYQHKAAPRVWLGYVGPCGLGARVRYWEFDHASQVASFTDANGDFTIASQPTPTNSNGFVLGGAPGDSIFARSSIDADTIDADITQRFDIVDWQLNVGGGVRHVGLAQRYSATGFNGNTIIATSQVGRRFDGNGPTVFAEIRRPLFDTRFSAIANTRASFCYGESKLFARDALPGGPVDIALLRHGATIAIGEIQVGGEFAVNLGCGRYGFVQAMWEAQHWDGAGNASGELDDLGLTGFSLSAGLWR